METLFDLDCIEVKFLEPKKPSEITEHKGDPTRGLLDRIMGKPKGLDKVDDAVTEEVKGLIRDLEALVAKGSPSVEDIRDVISGRIGNVDVKTFEDS